MSDCLKPLSPSKDFTRLVSPLILAQIIQFHPDADFFASDEMEDALDLANC